MKPEAGAAGDSLLRRAGPFAAGLWSRRWQIVYVALGAWLAQRVASFYDAHTGYTPLISFGERFAARRLPQLDDVAITTLRHSDGYDGQFYAQLAVAGNPFDPGLRRALDSPPYRSRRILLPLLAYVVGLGQPRWVLNVYALANLVAWLCLAVVLSRWWFPPTDLHNFLRWGGTLFCAGMVGSVTLALTDGPALLLVALGVRCLEVGRRWWGAALLGAAGLTRETSVLAVGGLLPERLPDRRAARAVALASLRAMALVVLPIAGWAAILYLRDRAGGGARNFDLPGAALLRKVQTIAAHWRQHGWDLNVRDELLATLAIATQVGFVLARPRPRELWWRVAAPFALTAFVLGWAVWEGMPGAATRVLLPLALAFNVLVPRTRLGLVLLLAGNVSAYSAPRLAMGYTGERTSLLHGITYDHGPGWYGSEHLGTRTWRWARGSAPIVFHNPTQSTYRIAADFELRSVMRRQVVVRAGDVAQALQLEPQRGVPVTFGPFSVAPGDTTLLFTTDEPPWVETAASARPLSFSVQGFSPRVVAAGARASE